MSLNPAFPRLIGYGLLISTLIYIFDSALPLQLTDPAWTIGFISIFLERLSVIFVALVFIFLGEWEERSRWEKPILKMLSWLTLVAGLLVLLLIPLGVSAGINLGEQTKANINAQYQQQLLQLQQAQDRLKTAKPDELQTILEQSQLQDSSLKSLNTDQFQEKLSNNINAARQKAAMGRDASQQKEQAALRQTVLKLSLLSIISSFVFFYSWALTGWVRQKSR